MVMAVFFGLNNSSFSLWQSRVLLLAQQSSNSYLSVFWGQGSFLTGGNKQTSYFQSSQHLTHLATVYLSLIVMKPVRETCLAT